MQADSLLLLSGIWGGISRYDEMQRCAEAALDLCRRHGDRLRTADSCVALGNAHSHRGEAEETIDCYREALRIREDAADVEGQARALVSLGQAFYNRGEFNRAMEHYDRALGIIPAGGDVKLRADILTTAGFARHQLGDHAAALDNYRRSLAIRNRIGDIQGIAFNHAHIGIVLQHLGDNTAALEDFTTALPILRRIGDRRSQANVLFYLGVIMQNRGEWDRALELLRESLATGRDIGDRQGAAYTLTAIGDLLCHRGDYAGALASLDEALAMVTGIADRYGQASILGNLGQACLMSGELPRAREALERSLAIATEIGHKSTACSTEQQLTALALAEGSVGEASKHAEAGAALALELDTPDLTWQALLLKARVDAARGKHERSDAGFGQAITEQETRERPLELALACFHYGRALGIRGERDRARPYGQRAKKLFTRLGAEGWLRRLREKETDLRPDESEVRLAIPPSLEPQRGSLKRSITAAVDRIHAFAREQRWEDLTREPFFDAVRIFDDKAAFDAFLLATTGMDPGTKLPAEFCAALEERILIAVSPEMYDAVYPDGREPGSYAKLLAHEIAHRLHIRILKGDEEAMGPVWFYEGFAIYAADQMNDPTYRLSDDELWHIVENPNRGSYKKYGAVIRQFLKKTTIKEMVERAGKDSYTRWLRTLY